MINGLLGNEVLTNIKIYTCIPKFENNVRLQAKLESKNPIGLPVGGVRAIEVKRADLINNMDLSRFKNPSSRDFERVKNKYIPALKIIES